MTAVPKPLKFLRPHFDDLAALYEKWPAGSDRDALADTLSVLGMTYGEEREELQAVGLKEVIPAIRLLIANEATLLNGRYDRIILTGISMGGATSVHTLFNLHIPTTVGGRLGAFMGFSCRCPFVGRSLGEIRDVLGLDDVPTHDGVLRSTPMLLEHCVDDPLVLVQHGRSLRDTLSGFGANVVWKEYPIERALVQLAHRNR